MTLKKIQEAIPTQSLCLPKVTARAENQRRKHREEMASHLTHS